MADPRRGDLWDEARRGRVSASRDRQADDSPVTPPSPPQPKEVRPAATRRARSPYVWARRLLLILGFVTLASLVLMLAAYRFGRTERAGGEEEAVAQGGDDQTLTAGEGFDYTQWSGGNRVFRIRSEQSRRNRDETVALEQVTLDIFRSDGEIYTINSRRARFNEGTWAAELEGDVVLAGWGELEMRARALELQRNGEVLVSKGAVEFSYPPNIEGRATRLRIDRREDVVSLSGGVHLRTIPGAAIPMRLDGERLTYRRDEAMIRVLDDVFVRRGDQTLRARSLTFYLEEDNKTLRNVRARWDVSVAIETVEELGGVSRVSLATELLEVQPLPEHPGDYRARLEGGNGAPAVLTLSEYDGMARRLVGQWLEIRTSAGRVEHVAGEGEPLVLDEYLDLDEPFLLRQACARRMTAGFLSDGTLGHLQLDEQVEIHDTEIQVAGGQSATLDGETGTLDITGPAVELYDSRGQVTSRHISYSRDRGVIRASQGVRAVMTDGSGMAGAPFGDGEGPVRIESSEALWTLTPPVFTFRGGARAWQGQNLLFADQIRGDQAGREMAASGGVKTVWVSRGSGPEATQPTTVEAQRMSFLEQRSEIIYQEDVKIVQGNRTVTCGELVVELEQGTRQAEQMTCQGEVLLVDPEAGRRVKGERIVFHLKTSHAEVFGDKVELIDASRNTLTGKYLLYDLRAGTVELKGRPPVEPTQQGGR